MTTTNTATLQVTAPIASRWVGRCKGCSRGFRFSAASVRGRVEIRGRGREVHRGTAGRYCAIECPSACPGFTVDGAARTVLLTEVRGRRSDKRCDARCESATGHNCECACGGENHGAAHDC